MNKAVVPLTYPYLQAIMAEGKEHALSVGRTQLSTEDMYVY